MPGERPTDDQLLDLRGPLVQRRDADVAEVALDGVVVDVARAAVDLDRRVRAVHGGLGRVQLGDRGLGRVRLAGVLEVTGAPHEHPGGVGLNLHVGEHSLDELEACDRLAELDPLLGVLDRRLDAALTDADAAGGDAVATGVKRAHRDLEPVAHLAEHLLVGDLDVVERDRRCVRAAEAHLVMDRLRLEARLVGIDEEAGETAVGLRRIGLGEDQRHLGVVAHRDPHLRPVDDPAGVGLARAGALVGGVGAGVRLGEAEAPEPLPGAQLRQVVVLLLLGSPAQDRRAHERGLHRDDGSHRRVAASDLLDDQSVGQVVKPGATVLARHDRAEVPLLGHLAHELEVEVLVAIVLPRLLDDLVVGERTRRLPDEALLVA